MLGFGDPRAQCSGPPWVDTGVPTTLGGDYTQLSLRQPADTHDIAVLSAISFNGLIQILLASKTKLLNGFCHSTQRTIDFFRVQIFCIIVQHAKDQKHFIS